MLFKAVLTNLFQLANQFYFIFSYNYVGPSVAYCGETKK